MIDFNIYCRTFGDAYLVRTPWRPLHYFCTAVHTGLSYGDKECYYTLERLMRFDVIWKSN